MSDATTNRLYRQKLTRDDIAAIVGHIEDTAHAKGWREAVQSLDYITRPLADAVRYWADTRGNTPADPGIAELLDAWDTYRELTSKAVES